MKTIKKIADEIGVSKQAVFYRMDRAPLVQALEGLVTRGGSSLMVSVDGEKLIKQAFGVKKASKLGEITEILRGTTNALIAQLERKDRQIAGLIDTIKLLSKSTKTAQKSRGENAKKDDDKGKTSAPIERLKNAK